MFVRFAFLGIFCVICFSCREIQPLSTILSLTGYELKGRVTNQNGLPIDGVEVFVYYNTEIAGTTPMDTVQVIVTDSTQIVDVAVYTSNYDFVKQLYLGSLSPGNVPRFVWNGSDENQSPVPSGKYFVRYTVNNAIIKFSTIIIEGHRTAATDALGRFKITADHLPIDELFDAHYPNGAYYATKRVLPYVDLGFQKQGLYGFALAIQLTKDRITNGVFTIQ